MRKVLLFSMKQCKRFNEIVLDQQRILRAVDIKEISTTCLILSMSVQNTLSVTIQQTLLHLRDETRGKFLNKSLHLGDQRAKQAVNSVIRNILCGEMIN